MTVADHPRAAPASAATIVTVLDAQQLPFRTQSSDWAQQFVSTNVTDVDSSAVRHLTGTWVGHP